MTRREALCLGLLLARGGPEAAPARAPTRGLLPACTHPASTPPITRRSADPAAAAGGVTRRSADPAAAGGAGWHAQGWRRRGRLCH